MTRAGGGHSGFRYSSKCYGFQEREKEAIRAFKEVNREYECFKRGIKRACVLKDCKRGSECYFKRGITWNE